MARKVNKKLVSIIVVAGIAFLAAGYVVYRLRHKDPKVFIARGDALLKEGKLEEAGRHYATAATVLKDPTLWLKAGDCYNSIAYDDIDNLRKAIGMWSAAISIDAGYVPALKRLLDFYKEDLDTSEGAAKAEKFDGPRDCAEKLLKADPENKEAKALIQMLVIRAWLSNIETDPQKVDDALKALIEQQKADPTNSDVALYVALALQKRADANANSVGAPTGEALYADAVKSLEDAIKAQEDNADMHWRASQFFRTMVGRMPNKELREKYLMRRRQELEHAVKASKPTDRFYADSRLSMAELLTGEGKLTEAIQLCREGIDQHPSQELFIKRKLALLLASRPESRDDAISMLATPPQLTAEQKSGLRGARFKDVELVVSADLANLRLDKAQGLGNDKAAEREALMKQVNDTLSLLSVRAPEWPYTARLQGKLALYTNKPGDAIRYFTKAMNAMGDSTGEKYEVMFLLANANRQAAQFGEAKNLLQKIVEQFPTYAPARLMLAEMYLRESDLTSAKPHIEELQKTMPDSPRVKKMSIALLVEQKAPPEQIQKLYSQLAENNRNDRMEKAVVAVLTKNVDDAQRLLTQILKEDPSDIEAAVSLSRLLDKQKNDRAGAVAVIDAIAKLKGSDPNIMLEQKRLSGATPDQMQAETGEIIETSLTGVEKELAMMELERSKKNIPGMLEHLKLAEELAPNDQRVLDLRFNYALIENNWDAANKYLQKLAAPDVNGDKVNGQLYRWRLARAQGDLPKALEVATALQHEYGAFAQSYVALAQTQQAMGKYDEAMTNYLEAVKKQPQNLEAQRGLIECSYARNRPQEAKKYIDQALAIYRNDPQLLTLADDWDLKYGTPDKALATREEALKKNPDSREAYMQLGIGYIEAAKLKETQKNDEVKKDFLTKARAIFEQAMAKFPDEPTFTTNFASAAVMLNDYPAAQKAWLSLASRDAFKDKIETMQLLADFYCNSGKFDDAEKVVREFMTRHPEQTDARFSLSSVHAWQKKYDQAAADLGDSDDPRIVSRKTQLYISAGMLDQAEKVLAPIAASGHASVDQLNQLGYIYQRQHKPQQAVTVLNQTLAQDPKNTTALLYRAAALLDQPQPNLDDLVRDLQTIRQTNPNNMEGRRLLAECYRRKGDFQAELRELEDLTRLSPTEKQPWIVLLQAYSSSRPPRWGDADRVAEDIKKVPELTNDIDMLLAIAQMQAARGKAQDSKDAFQKALVNIEAALRQQPKNQRILQVFYTVMIQGKAYPQLINHTDQMPPEIRDLWWIKQDRAICHAKLKDAATATKEFNEALNQCLAAKDDASAQLVVNSMANELGEDTALHMVEKQLQNGDAHWLMLAAGLQQRKGDIPAARKLVDQVMAAMDKLSEPEQAQILRFAGILFMIDPDPQMDKAKSIYERLTKIRPDDYLVWNNLACMRDITPAQSLEYSQKAVDLMRRSGKPEPYVLDTWGWNLVQANRLDEGINALNDAWAIEQFPDLAYHLGVANLRKGNLDEAERNLGDARKLFQEKLEAKAVTNMKLDDDITAAQRDLRDARAKGVQGADATPSR